MKNRWIVRFAFRYQNQAQADAVRSLGGLACDVVRLWCIALVPGARVFEPPGEPIKTIGFPTRASARRFIKVWGGRIATTPTAGFTPPPGPGLSASTGDCHGRKFVRLRNQTSDQLTAGIRKP